MDKLSLKNEMQDLINRLKLLEKEVLKDENKDTRHLLYQQCGVYAEEMIGLMRRFKEITDARESRLREDMSGRDQSGRDDIR